jgi:glycosyltransferase involved in cell wall biosynthesis
VTVALRLGVDADPVGRDGSGNETYLRGMLGGIARQRRADESVVVAGRNTAALEEAVGSWAKVVAVPAGLQGELSLGRRLQAEGATVALGHYTAPLGFRGPVMTVVHDVAFLRLGSMFPRALRWRMRMTVGRSVRRSNAIVTVSEFSRAEILNAYPSLSPAKVIVTPDAVDAAFSASFSSAELDDVRTRLNLPDRFVLAVGNLQPRKNLRRLVEATTAVGVCLVIAGRPHWGKETAVSSSDVRWLGYVDARDLVALYRLCAVFAYPSLYEGFGLPALEAMAGGAPVVTSSTTAIPEVVGDAAILVDPTNVGSIAEGLRVVLDDAHRADDLRARGRERIGRFSWDDSANVLLERARQLHTQRGTGRT